MRTRTAPWLMTKTSTDTLQVKSRKSDPCRTLYQSHLYSYYVQIEEYQSIERKCAQQLRKISMWILIPTCTRERDLTEINICWDVSGFCPTSKMQSRRRSRMKGLRTSQMVLNHETDRTTKQQSTTLLHLPYLLHRILILKSRQIEALLLL